MRSIIVTIVQKDIELISISRKTKLIWFYLCLVYNNFEIVISKGYDKQYEQISTP